jgi:hypothetical protein
MDTPIPNQELSPKRPFPLFAARYSLFVSCSAAVLATFIYLAMRFAPDSMTRFNFGFAAMILFFTLLSSLMMGIASLFGIRRYGVRPILWRAIIGIAVSSFFGFYSGIAWGLTQMNYRC